MSVIRGYRWTKESEMTIYVVRAMLEIVRRIYCLTFNQADGKFLRKERVVQPLETQRHQERGIQPMDQGADRESLRSEH